MTIPPPGKEPHSLLETARQLPKAELHLHLLGAASSAFIKAKSKQETPETTKQRLKAEHEFRRTADFQTFLAAYLSVARLIKTDQDLFDLIADVGDTLWRDNVVYAEVSLSPYSLITRNFPPEAIGPTLTAGRTFVKKTFDVDISWCFDISGGAGIEAADVTLEAIKRYPPEGLMSIGLGGNERHFDCRIFANHFAQAKALGPMSVPHAGESRSIHTVANTIKYLRPDRIGHGISIVQSTCLMEMIMDLQIPIEVCPTSNIRTGSVPQMNNHPLIQFAEIGIPFSINSDDPGVFTTQLSLEYERAAQALGGRDQSIYRFAESGVDHSFMGVSQKVRLKDQLKLIRETAPS